MTDWETKERRILRAIDKDGFFHTANGVALRLCEEMRERGIIQRAAGRSYGFWERAA